MAISNKLNLLSVVIYLYSVNTFLKIQMVNSGKLLRRASSLIILKKCRVCNLTEDYVSQQKNLIIINCV